MAFRVKQTAQADYDLDLILEWLLAQQAGDAGLRWFRKLKEIINSLAEMPERCMVAPENTNFPSRCASSFTDISRIIIGCCLLSTPTLSLFFIFDTVAAGVLTSRIKLR